MNPGEEYRLNLGRASEHIEERDSAIVTMIHSRLFLLSNLIMNFERVRSPIWPAWKLY